MKKNTVLHSLRVVSSFALLGTVAAGTLLGWIDHPPIDVRTVGAVAGAAVPIIMKLVHFG